jgi:hypothetical protein
MELSKGECDGMVPSVYFMGLWVRWLFLRVCWFLYILVSNEQGWFFWLRAEWGGESI